MDNIDTSRKGLIMDFLKGIGINISENHAEELSDEFVSHIYLETELTAPISIKDECEKCKVLQSENEKLKQDINIYKKSVLSRRSANSVWIENGKVMYD